MGPQDRPVFAEAATRLNLWILVRRTNAASLAYLGRPGFVPKPTDLYDIIIPGQENRNLAAAEELLGQPHPRGKKLYEVQKFINSRIGCDMVQHGGEARYADHSEQPIDIFGPGGELCTILNEFSVRGWYRERFHGRRTSGIGG